MSDDKEVRIPHSEPPQEPSPFGPPPPRSGTDGCLIALGKAIIIVIGAFVLAGLVFATCFLSFRR